MPIVMSRTSTPKGIHKMWNEDVLRPDLVGMAGFAEVAGLSISSIRQFQRFGRLPAPLSGATCPLIWRRVDAEAWAAAYRASK